VMHKTIIVSLNVKEAGVRILSVRFSHLIKVVKQH
jgi:hypothetical protein